MKPANFDDVGALALEAIRPVAGERITGAIGRAIADVDRWVRRGRRLRVERNLRRFGPELSSVDRAELSRRVYRDRWVGEPLYDRWVRGDLPPAPLTVGLERVTRALEAGKGVILWESPFGSRSWMHLTLHAAGIPYVRVQGAEHGGSSSWIGQNVVRPLKQRREARCVPEVIDIQEGAYGYLRQIKKRLAENRVVCMPGLGPKGRRFLRLSFLGGEESFATGVAGLAAASGAALIPVFCFCEPSGDWKTCFEEPIPAAAGDDRKEAQFAAVEAYSRILETYVRRYPEQWRRWHAEPISAAGAKLSAVSIDRSQAAATAADDSAA